MTATKISQVKQEDVEKALDEIDRVGFPRKKKSTGYCMVSRDSHYPPKYVLKLAYQLKTGEKLVGFRGGKPVNNPLQALGYLIEKCGKCDD
jgi:hypothetical protein